MEAPRALLKTIFNLQLQVLAFLPFLKDKAHRKMIEKRSKYKRGRVS